MPKPRANERKLRSGRSPSRYFDRSVDTREPRQRFLIVCEGKKTEPAYFRSFRVPRHVIEVHGLGDNTLGVVQRAIAKRGTGEYDQVWCVFDRDSFPAVNFNAALDLARREGIHVAYSNQAFELWYVLHFEFLNTGIDRVEYCSKLSHHLGEKYRKNSATMYAQLVDRQRYAIANACKLLVAYSPADPVSDNPSTTVHLLVEQLNRYLV